MKKDVQNNILIFSGLSVLHITLKNIILSPTLLFVRKGIDVEINSVGNNQHAFIRSRRICVLFNDYHLSLARMLPSGSVG